MKGKSNFKRINKIFLLLLFMILGFSCIYASTSFTMNLSELQSSSFKQEILRMGDGYDAPQFTINHSGFNKFYATCSERKNALPLKSGTSPSNSNNWWVDSMVCTIYTPEDSDFNRVIAAITYYGYNGDGQLNVPGATKEAMAFATHWMLNYKVSNQEGDLISIANAAAGTSNWESVRNDRNKVKTFYQALLDKVNNANNDSNLDKVSYAKIVPNVKPGVLSEIKSEHPKATGSGVQTLMGYYGAYSPKGNLVIEKKDTNGNFLNGAEFHIEGPGKSWDETTENGKITLNDITPGQYTIKETKAPTGMVLDTETHTATVTAGKTTTYTLINGYQRGGSGLVKYDYYNRGNTLGDATLAGAVFGLYAAEDIYEGETLIYNSGDLVQGNIVTDASGNTSSVSDLPIGNYYYQEISPSEGFLLNPDKYPISVGYSGQDSSTGSSGSVEVPEKEKFGNIKIIKKGGATDYQSEVNLFGIQFKAYLISNPSQEYYATTNSSGEATFSHLPYGKYRIVEVSSPVQYYSIDDFEVFVSENDQTYTYTKIDPAKLMHIKIRKVDAERKDSDPTDYKQGDATLQGAKYGIYYDLACTQQVGIITVNNKDSDGYWYAESLNLLTDTYYVKELIKSTGIDPNGNTVYYSYAEGYLVDPNVYTFEGHPESQTYNTNLLIDTSKEKVVKFDIKIIKRGGATDYQDEVFLKDIEFTATLKSDRSKVYRATTNEEGIATFKDIPYGEYEIQEVKGHVQYYLIGNFTVVGHEVKVYGYDKTDAPKLMHIRIKKVDKDRLDTDPPYYFQGDAKLQGAKYGMYYDEACTKQVGVITVDRQDSEGYWYAESLNLLTDTYYVKELISHSEIVNGKQVDYSYAEGYLVDPNVYKFEGHPETQTFDTRLLIDTSYERVVLGRVIVRKYNNNVDTSIESPAKGAKLILTLKSRPEIQYVAYVQADGTAEFINPRMTKYSPYTIPYGEYEITEEASSDNKVYYFMNPEIVNIPEEEEVEVRTVADEPVETYLKLIKKDKISKKQVKIGGGVYKIWDCQEGKFVVQDEPFTGHDIDEFITNDEGFLITPRTLLPGDYVIYEKKAPKGYYLDDELRLPENSADYGNEEKGGVKVTIDKITDGLEEDAQPGEPPIYTVEISNSPLMGKLEIYKTGEQLTDYTVEWNEKYGDIYKPVYTTLGLKGVTYKVYTAEDIKSPDGTYTYTPANTLVDTITTGEDGIATTKDLYLGKYRVEEVETPIGFIPEKEEMEVTLTNEDQYVKVETTHETLNNVRRHFELNFYKTFEEGDYIYSNEEGLQATFGLYTNEDIRNVNGDVVIPKGSLIDIIVAKEGEIAKSSVDMPAGDYYYLELDVSSQRFKMDANKHQIEAQHDSTNNLTTILIGENVNNEIVKADLLLFKVSVSTFMKANDTGLRGTVLDMEHILEQIEELERELADKEETEAEELLVHKDLKLLSGAEYTVYVDEECTTPLKRKNGEEVKIITDLSGIDKIEDIEMGTYYIKETKAPSTEIDGEEIKYDLKEEPLKVELTLAMDGQSVYRALVDTITLGTFINKTDIFTGDLVPDCEFEIRDLEGNIVVHSTTDEEGKAYIPLDLLEQGKEYIYQELNAPDIYKEDGKLYELNTEEHHFTADYEINEETGEVTFDEVKEVENYRPKIKKLIVRKVDSKTGEPLEGCKFSIVLLDENGEPYVNEAGETVYLVKEGITGENGEFELEDPVYGTYKFIEIEPPEGYELDDGMDGMVFTINDKTEDTLIFEVTNTGDIAVIALVCVAVVCVMGIVFVIVRNKKRVNN